MQTTSSMPASAASMIASAAKAGGTKMMLTLAPVAFTPSATVLKTGRSRCWLPPLPGVTPPTTLVPYSIICPAWKLPSVPVNPCTRILEDLLTRMLISSLELTAKLREFNPASEEGRGYFRRSSMFRSGSILPRCSSMRMSLASLRKSEAKMKSFRRWFLLKMIS